MLVGNHRHGGRARPSKIFVRKIKELLIVRIGMDRRHDAMLNAEIVQQTLATGAKQLVVQEALETIWCDLAS